MKEETSKEKRALLFDLGDTLEHAGTVQPGALETLEMLSNLALPSGEMLLLGLVSDYVDPAPGSGPEEVERLFEDYVDRVRKLGILRFFEPPSRHVTLSTQAGARKPDRRVFELALERLGLPPDLATAVFVTESVEHVTAARKLGMTALRFGEGGEIPTWAGAGPALLEALGFRVPRDDPDRYLEVLKANRRVELPGEAAPPGATHVLETGPDGSTKPRRRGYDIS